MTQHDPFDPVELIARVKKVMEADGITVTEVAKRTGHTKGYVSQILSASRFQTRAKALLLGHAVGLVEIVDEA